MFDQYGPQNAVTQNLSRAIACENDQIESFDSSIRSQTYKRDQKQKELAAEEYELDLLRQKRSQHVTSRAELVEAREREQQRLKESSQQQS